MTPSELTLRGLLRIVGGGLVPAAVVYLGRMAQPRLATCATGRRHHHREPIG